MHNQNKNNYKMQNNTARKRNFSAASSFIHEYSPHVYYYFICTQSSVRINEELKAIGIENINKSEP